MNLFRVFGSCFFLFFSMLSQAASPGWNTSGASIIDPHGNEVVIKAVNWFGFETETHVAHGLWARNLEEMLAEIKGLGFNAIRLPYSNDILEPSVKPTSINYSLNSQLASKTALEVFDYFINEATKAKLYIILDRHRPTAVSQSELWYTSSVSEEKWIRDWVFMADRYKNNLSVVGFDLHNEPHGKATWGTGVLETDWKSAVERAGNEILKINSYALIIVEGIQYDNAGESYWWGGTLDRVYDSPVQLNIPNKVVYSSHDYGPGVTDQPWFNAANFPSNLEPLWDRKWGYIAKNNIAPLWVGEFGGKLVDLKSKEGIWQNTLVDYLKKEKLNFAYWCWNPNSGDTGGILMEDWKTLDKAKVGMLKRLLNEAVILE